MDKHPQWMDKHPRHPAWQGCRNWLQLFFRWAASDSEAKTPRRERIPRRERNALGHNSAQESAS